MKNKFTFYCEYRTGSKATEFSETIHDFDLLIGSICFANMDYKYPPVNCKNT